MLRFAAIFAIAITVIGGLMISFFGGWALSPIYFLTAVAVATVGYGILTKSKWGINVEPVKCPNCRTSAPVWRKPTSFNQMMWGGHTCSQCGTEMDKWGHEIARPTNTA